MTGDGERYTETEKARLTELEAATVRSLAATIVDYERDYILPCYGWAREIDFDLQKAVFDNPGQSCVALLVRRLTEERLTVGRILYADKSIDNGNFRTLVDQALVVRKLAEIALRR